MTTENLSGRSAIVTGGGSGIGQAIALELTAAGVNCVIAGRREEALAETVGRNAGPGRIVHIGADIRDPGDRGRVVQAAIAQFGGLDILVDNAGITSLTPMLEYTVEEWRNVFATHAEAAFFLAQAAIPELRKSSQARIINIGSVYGSLGINNDYYGDGLPWDNASGSGPVREFAYAAAKGAVLQLTRELATAVGRWGITVNSVTPGMIPVDDMTCARGDAGAAIADDPDRARRQARRDRHGRPIRGRRRIIIHDWVGASSRRRMVHLVVFVERGPSQGWAWCFPLDRDVRSRIEFPCNNLMRITSRPWRFFPTRAGRFSGTRRRNQNVPVFGCFQGDGMRRAMDPRRVDEG
jgi:NAD(P)-dependent dehydrogenase (short-subunit alcohol dehydrogenase family)